MPYNEDLANRVRAVLSEHSTVTEKKMFGGLTFMLDGYMCCGIVNDDLVVRVGKEQNESALAQPIPGLWTSRVDRWMAMYMSAPTATALTPTWQIG